MNKFRAGLLAALCMGGAGAQTTDTIAKAKSSGEITMGVRDASGALSYTLGDGQFVGFHVDICHRIIAQLEKQIGKKLTIKYLSVTSQNRVPLTQNGTVDIECGSTTNNEARQKQVAFAFTTYVEEVRIATKVNSGVLGIAQLNGRNVATTTGTTSVQLLRKHERAADERRGFDAQDAVAEVREGEVRRLQRRAFAITEATLRPDREHGGFRWRGNLWRTRPFIRIERELPGIRIEADECFGQRSDARHFRHECRASLLSPFKDMLAPFALFPERAREIARISLLRFEENNLRHAKAREVMEDFLGGLRTWQPDEYRER
jgi:hypothetical protein